MTESESVTRPLRTRYIDLLESLTEAIMAAEDGWDYAPQSLREKWHMTEQIDALRAVVQDGHDWLTRTDAGAA